MFATLAPPGVAVSANSADAAPAFTSRITSDAAASDISREAARAAGVVKAVDDGKVDGGAVGGGPCRLACGHTVVRTEVARVERPLLVASDFRAPRVDLFRFALVGDGSCVMGCPTCRIESLLMGDRGGGQIRRVMARVHLGEEHGHRWTHEIVDPTDALMYVPPAVASDRVACTNDTLKKANCLLLDLQSLSFDDCAVREYHLVTCPCGERKCCGFLIQPIGMCMHCSAKALGKCMMPERATQIDAMRLMTPSELRRTLLHGAHLL